uniref:RNA-dependent RNA polymerase n=1 Tax=Culex tritaeniorhynchus partitivirus TaxID=2686048 RepID=A0A6F8PZC6_9VIRU|nr:RNA-dependent RNA polymerase [Culex tritaeniorhynchus partitivirus]
MALLDFKLTPAETFGRAHVYLTDVKYRPPLPFVSKYGGSPPSNITILPEAHKGFSYDMSLPYVDFKAVRACYEGGAADLATRVLRTTRRSHITTDHLYDSVLNYGSPSPPRVTDSVYQRCLEELKEQFDVNTKLEPLSLREAADKIPQNTSPGLPWIQMYPSAKKGEILSKHFDSIADDWKAVENGARKYPLPDCAAFGRSHIGSAETNKVRAVWVVPLTVVAAEARFALPVIDLLTSQTIGHNTAYGCEMMKGGMKWVNDQALWAKNKDPGAKYLMTDYSSFDANVPAWMIRDCFAILRQKFNLTAAEANVFRKCVSYFINTPIQFADKRRILKNHGVPSGSMWTNIIDTMVNFLQTRYCIYTLTRAAPLFDVYFGDDGLIALPGHAIINLEDISATAMEKFGAVVNTKKSYWTNRPRNIHFLGYYNANGSCYKKPEGLVASFLYPQHMQDDWAYTLARGLGVLLASAGDRTIYKIVRQAYIMARRVDGAVEKGFELVSTHPRMVRHLRQMGAEVDNLSTQLFESAEMSIPAENCRKLELNIMLVK